MELELVSIAYRGSEAVHLKSIVLVKKGASLLEIQQLALEGYTCMSMVHGFTFVNFEEIGRIPFHQEDAHALGLEVNSIL